MNDDKTLMDYCSDNTSITIDKAKWKDLVLANSTDSYGLVICAAAILLAENPNKPMHELLRNNICGLSGFQASTAITYAAVLVKSGIMEND